MGEMKIKCFYLIYIAESNQFSNQFFENLWHSWSKILIQHICPILYIEFLTSWSKYGFILGSFDSILRTFIQYSSLFSNIEVFVHLLDFICLLMEQSSNISKYDGVNNSIIVLLTCIEIDIHSLCENHVISYFEIAENYVHRISRNIKHQHIRNYLERLLDIFKLSIKKEFHVFKFWNLLAEESMNNSDFVHDSSFLMNIQHIYSEILNLLVSNYNPIIYLEHSDEYKEVYSTIHFVLRHDFLNVILLLHGIQSDLFIFILNSTFSRVDEFSLSDLEKILSHISLANSSSEFYKLQLLLLFSKIFHRFPGQFSFDLVLSFYDFSIFHSINTNLRMASIECLLAILKNYSDFLLLDNLSLFIHLFSKVIHENNNIPLFKPYLN